jgi:hypothetical protein
MAFSLLGADVVLTDLADITPLIQKNVDANFIAGKIETGKLGRSTLCSSAWKNDCHYVALVCKVGLAFGTGNQGS